MAKNNAKKTSYNLSIETIRLLELLKADTHRLSVTNVIEWLVKAEAERRNLK